MSLNYSLIIMQRYILCYTIWSLDYYNWEVKITRESGWKIIFKCNQQPPTNISAIRNKNKLKYCSKCATFFEWLKKFCVLSRLKVLWICYYSMAHYIIWCKCRITWSDWLWFERHTHPYINKFIMDHLWAWNAFVTIMNKLAHV